MHDGNVALGMLEITSRLRCIEDIYSLRVFVDRVEFVGASLKKWRATNLHAGTLLRRKLMGITISCLRSS